MKMSKLLISAHLQRSISITVLGIVLAMSSPPVLAKNACVTTDLEKISSADRSYCGPNIFLSLEDAVSALAGKSKDTNAGDEIVIYPGTYRLARTLVIDGASFPDGLVVRAKKAGTVWISGGAPLSPLEELSPSERDSLPAPANSLAKVARLSGGRAMLSSDFQTPVAAALFFKSAALPISRWPEEGFGVTNSVASDHQSFGVDPAPPPLYGNWDNVWANGYWGTDWADQLTRIIVGRNGIRFSVAHPLKYSMSEGRRVVLYNSPSLMFQPGQWSVNARGDKYLVIPPTDYRSGEEITVPVVDVLFNILGARDVVLEGLSWEEASSSAIVARNVYGLRIESCKIRNIGGTAIVLQGMDSYIRRCEIADVGAGGIDLEGGDRQTLKPGRIYVENSKLYQFNQWSWTYSPAILIKGVGNAVRDSTISGGTHSAIIFYGNDHVIENNDISHVVMETGDAGAIYTGRDTTARGNIVRNNFLHDIVGVGSKGATAVYLDDQAAGNSVFKNVFLRVHRGVLIGGGRDNDVENNIFLASKSAIYMDARGLSWQKGALLDRSNRLAQELARIPYQSTQYAKYPHLANILVDEPGAPIYNIVRNNVVIGGDLLDQDNNRKMDATRWLFLSNNALGERCKVDIESDALLPLVFVALRRCVQFPAGFKEIHAPMGMRN
ncbi:right-handed parallel beta-helix repeat-containing protein [Paraburkholderia sp. SIMBA_030]|uniref:right-handed parallel beta-helix repeat-containing protein n=1 Tax=Paraburkholderia sp. SIMBA_030 TaxID=3085773 RepID=UPI00397B2116